MGIKCFLKNELIYSQMSLLDISCTCNSPLEVSYHTGGFNCLLDCRFSYSEAAIYYSHYEQRYGLFRKQLGIDYRKLGTTLSNSVEYSLASFL